MVNSVAYVSSDAKKGCGALNSLSNPFRSVDAAVTEWYNSLCPKGDPDASDSTLTIVIKDDGEYDLRLSSYTNIEFIGKGASVVLESEISSTETGSKFTNVKFADLTHVVTGLSGGQPDPIEYDGLVEYTGSGRLIFETSREAPRPNLTLKAPRIINVTLPPLPGITTVFSIIPGTGILRLNVPLVINAPGESVVGIFNSGSLSLTLDRARFGAGAVVDGPGSTAIHNADVTTQSSLIVDTPNLSFLLSGLGAKRVLDMRLTVSKAPRTVPNNIFIPPTRDERNPNTPPTLDTMYLIRGTPVATALTVALLPEGPYTEVSRSTINACGVEDAVVFLADTANVRNTYNDLICVNLIGATAPTFSVYGSSSLVTNGSTFLLPTIIRGNYEHLRLDGTIFYVNVADSEPRHHKKANRIKLSCSQEWNGRLITYIRIDKSRETVTIEAPCKIQGHSGHINLSCGQSITLHMLDGEWWIVSLFDTQSSLSQ